MPFNNETIAGLRDALRVSPENLPLRQALGDALMGVGRYQEAEAEYRQALTLSAENAKLKTSLARAFYLQGKTSHAMVILDALLREPEPPPAAFLLQARLLARGGQIDRAAKQYTRAFWHGWNNMKKLPPSHARQTNWIRDPPFRIEYFAGSIWIWKNIRWL